MDKLYIKKDAILVSDAHEGKNRGYLKEFLSLIYKNKIKTKQLFLMGDMFDILVGDIEHTCKINKYNISLINEIAKKIDIFYFEGNHDFRLKNIFSNKITIFPIKYQPVLFCSYSSKDKILLSHGDLYLNFKYRLYTLFIRSKYLLYILNVIDKVTKNIFTIKILDTLCKKKICNEIDNFECFAQKRINKYIYHNQVDYIVEGHYHQGKKCFINNKGYFNLPSLACNRGFFRFSDKPFKFEELTLEQF